MDIAMRIEKDGIGQAEIPGDVLWGIHTLRAMDNFPLAGRPVHPSLIHAYGQVKLACATTNRRLGFFDQNPKKADAIEQACREMAAGRLDRHIVVDLLQGGAGTSTNMNVNEVLANRALEILGEPHGRYDIVSPLDDINRHQSTNDTYPTALRLATIRLLHELESRVLSLQEAFQAKEKQFDHVVKVGRTELQDAVLTTLGREMAAYAEAFNRDRWRIYKCEERLRTVNLGGTAIGTGLAAPRQFIFRAADTLRELTGIGFARAENLIDATQNVDVFVEVSGILKALAASLFKVASDLRFLSSGPEAGIGEIRLPDRQAGSSIMPGKVNPVIPEAVSQAALWAMGQDATIGLAAAMGNLELNPFLPLIASCLLENIEILTRASDIFRRHCVEGIEADEARCRRHVDASTSVATALLSVVSYAEASRIAERARKEGTPIREIVIEEKILSAERFDQLVSPESVCRLGSE